LSSSSSSPSSPSSSSPSSHIVKAENALLTALKHLEKERDELLAQGNENAAAVIDDIIAELTELVVTVSSNAIKNKFKFGNNGRGKGKGRPHIYYTK